MCSEDYHTARSNSTRCSSNNRNKGGGTSSYSGGGTAAILSNSGSLSTGIMPVTTTANTNTVAAMEEMDEVLIPIRDWFEAPESMKIYGSEKFVNAVYY